MYFSSKSLLMVLVTILVLPISKSAISSDSDGHTVAYRQATPPLSDSNVSSVRLGSSVNYDIEDCSRASLNTMLLSTDRFIPVNNINSRVEFHSKNTSDEKATVVNKFRMNGYLAQCKDTATIPFVNGKFIGDMQLSFRVFCHDGNPSWSVVNYDNTSLSLYGSAECKNDVLGVSLSEVKCIDAITAITDGETVTFFNIPPVFTKVKVIVESQNHSYQVQRKLRSNTRENTWTVPAKSLTYSGNAAVAPRKRFQILFYERKKQKPGTAETQFVTIKAAPEYNYVPQDHPQILGELAWIILVLAILSAVIYGVYRMFK